MKRVIHLFVAAMAVMAMASCNEKKTLEALGGEWDVVAIGEMAVPDSVGAFMGFDLAEKERRAWRLSSLLGYVCVRCYAITSTSLPRSGTSW